LTHGEEKPASNFAPNKGKFRWVKSSGVCERTKIKIRELRKLEGGLKVSLSVSGPFRREVRRPQDKGGDDWNDNWVFTDGESHRGKIMRRGDMDLHVNTEWKRS